MHLGSFIIADIFFNWYHHFTPKINIYANISRILQFKVPCQCSSVNQHIDNEASCMVLLLSWHNTLDTGFVHSLQPATCHVCNIVTVTVYQSLQSETERLTSGCFWLNSAMVEVGQKAQNRPRSGSGCIGRLFRCSTASCNKWVSYLSQTMLQRV